MSQHPDAMHFDPKTSGPSRKDRPEEDKDTVEDKDTAVEDAEQEEKRQLESGEENST